MTKKNRMISSGAGLLALAFLLLLTGRMSAGDDNAKAEKAIQALGGKVVRSPDVPGRPIIRVDFSDRQVSDAGLKELAALKSLQRLGLGGSPVTDAGLKELASLKSLRFLDFSFTQVTDVGLKELGGLNSLQSLLIGGTKISDASLKGLAGSKSLLRLGLGHSKVTDAGASALRKVLPNCRIVR